MMKNERFVDLSEFRAQENYVSPTPGLESEHYLLISKSGLAVGRPFKEHTLFNNHSLSRVEQQALNIIIWSVRSGI